MGVSIHRERRDSQKVQAVGPEVQHWREEKGCMRAPKRSWEGSSGEAPRLHEARAHKHVGAVAEGLGHSPRTRRRSPHFRETSPVPAGILEEWRRDGVHGRVKYGV